MRTRILALIVWAPTGALRVMAALAVVVLLVLGLAVGRLTAPADTCAQVANVYRGSAWVAWHAADATYDMRHGHVAWAAREGLDIGCALTHAGAR